MRCRRCRFSLLNSRCPARGRPPSAEGAAGLRWDQRSQHGCDSARHRARRPPHHFCEASWVGAPAETADRGHDAPAGPCAAHEDIAIVGVTHEAMAPPFQFAVPFVKDDIGQQRRQRPSLRCPFRDGDLCPVRRHHAAFSIRARRKGGGDDLPGHFNWGRIALRLGPASAAIGVRGAWGILNARPEGGDWDRE
jgi:hypothetical protein